MGVSVEERAKLVAAAIGYATTKRTKHDLQTDILARLPQTRGFSRRNLQRFIDKGDIDNALLRAALVAATNVPDRFFDVGFAIFEEQQQLEERIANLEEGVAKQKELAERVADLERLAELRAREAATRPTLGGPLRHDHEGDGPNSQNQLHTGFPPVEDAIEGSGG